MDNTEIKNKTIALYKDSGWKKFFAHIRFWDAPLTELERYIPKSGTIIELGCGDGILSNYLALSSKDRKVIGIDIDKKRIKEANKKLSNTKFVLGDIRKSEIPDADTIVISHVLHHFSSFEEQEKVINHCYKKLKKNGKLIIMEILVKNNLKYLNGWIFDHFLVPIFFEKRAGRP